MKGANPSELWPVGVVRADSLRYPQVPLVAGPDPLAQPVPVVLLPPESQEVSVAQEVPVALVFNGISHAVMMATPGDLEDFALGFGLTEGLLESPRELYGVEVQLGDQGHSVLLEVAAACEWRLKQRRRTLAGRTGCGLCGTDSLDQVQRPLAPVPTVSVSAQAVIDAMAQLRPMQTLGQLTGATHAAAWVNLGGAVQHIREDVGRHNALDKLVGHLVRHDIDVSNGFVAITSRASFEMVQKTISLGAGVLAAISAPTAMAVQMAQRHNLALAGQVKSGALTAYTHMQRFAATPPHSQR
jgi:FdhD protein